MDKIRIIELLENEVKCIKRQDTAECQRDELGCQGCDLLVETDEILKAYDLAIDIVKNHHRIAFICDRQKECMVKPGCVDNGGKCKHTQDISHAANFFEFNGDYLEFDEIDKIKIDKVKKNIK